MSYINVVIKPLVTEKSTHQANTRNAYAFEVSGQASKDQIRLAIEELYKVKVTGVRTMNRKGKPRRTKVGYTSTSAFKRAIVTLDENSKIELF